jgi:hypothetical protein
VNTLFWKIRGTRVKRKIQGTPKPFIRAFA